MWELLADEWLKDCQFYVFKEYKNINGDSILGGHANGSVSFQIAQSRLSSGKVPISIVLYIDATSSSEGFLSVPWSIYDIAYDILYLDMM